MSSTPSAPAAALIESAYRLADEVLYPAAAEVDRTGVIPDDHWRQIAAAGLYGMAAPADAGGPGLEFGQVIEILEVMASGCLPTAFTWLQHHGVVLSVAATDNAALRDELWSDLTSGRVRAGVAYAGAVPTPPRMSATRVDGGWRFTGSAPFVSGWGMADVIQISARDIDSDDVIAAILPAVPSAGLTASAPLQLTACSASRTVSLTVSDLDIADDRIVSRVPLDAFFATQNVGIRLNGTLPFGGVRRCGALLDIGGQPGAARALRERADTLRSRFDAALGDPAGLLAARADAARLATDATSALVAAAGGPALLVGAPPERLSRESVFTLVAASRPELKDLLLQRFSGSR